MKQRELSLLAIHGIDQLWLGTRFRRQLRAHNARPFRVLGVDRSARPSKELSCQECYKGLRVCEMLYKPSNWGVLVPVKNLLTHGNSLKLI
jgi:hypothetical protein